MPNSDSIPNLKKIQRGGCKGLDHLTWKDLFCFAFFIWMGSGWLGSVGSLFLSKKVFLPYCFWNMLLDAFLKLLSSATYVPTITVGCTTQRLQERIKQHVPKPIRQKTTLAQEQGTHRSQPTRTQPNRKCKAKSETQLEPESDSAIGQHLLESNQCALGWSLNTWEKLNNTNYHGNRSKCVPFRLKPSCVKNLRVRKTFIGCTKAIKFFINTQFCKDKGFSVCRV